MSYLLAAGLWLRISDKVPLNF